jgi:glyceraldehyde 3-phosphate dehydrogenase
MKRVAINGLGRIGRATLKILGEYSEFDLVAVNDLVPIENSVYLLKYDSVYGRYPKKVEYNRNYLLIDNKETIYISEKEPANLPWGDMNIDIVFECTGLFTNQEAMQKHIIAGAKYVILSTSSKSEETATLLYGINNPQGDISEGSMPQMISCASCTTNSVAPVIEIIGRRIGIKKALLTTTHAYTSSQSIVDSPNKKLSRGRAGAVNIVPTSTGAAIATTRALPQYKGKFDGVALRVPVPAGSISDITILTARPTSVQEVNQILKEEAASTRYREVMAVSEEALVSSDIIQQPYASLVDLTLTTVVDNDLVKIMTWYDNEWGYASQMVREATLIK